VAEYGIAALIAGGLAAKAGLFKVLLGALIALRNSSCWGSSRRQPSSGGCSGASRPTRPAKP